MNIFYRPAAIEDIRKTSEYIRDVLKNPTAATGFSRKVLHEISLLKENPEMGALLKNKFEEADLSYRYIIINKHFVFYELLGDTVEIIRVLDGRTDYMAQLF